MTSTNTFQGLDNGSKTSSRVLRPPGGGSSNLFGGCDEEVSSARRQHKMNSNIFDPPEDTQIGYKRANPPGGKSSGIFGQPEAHTTQQRAGLPGGVSNNIFGEPGSNPCNIRSHPNKPKDNIGVGVNATKDPDVPQQKVELQAETSDGSSLPLTPSKDDHVQESDSCPNKPCLKDHEPRLGPRPRSHNKVIHPPGGKSSVAFY